METVVTAKPHMILETVELLYAYVNHLSADSLTCPGVYCLPVPAVREILDAVCRDISLDNAALQYYFASRVFYEEPEQMTCIARNLCYTNSTISTGSVAEDFKKHRSMWRKIIKNNWRVTGLDRYNLEFTSSQEGQYVPIADSLTELGLTREYSNVLLEQISGYETALDRLEELITPIAKSLEPFLQPWVQQAGPLTQTWRDYYGGPDGDERLCRRLGYKQERRIERLYVQLRYFRPREGPGNNSWGRDSVYLHAGVAVVAENMPCEGFAPWEFQALRLLGSESRMQMLQAMMHRSMSSRELAKELNMHLGVVTRDISSLQFAQLLTLEVENRHRRYRTNMETIQTLIRHLSDLEHCKIVRPDRS